MKRFLLLLLLINFRHSIGQTYVLIPDANFANYFQTNIPAAMSGNSLDITSPLVTTSTQTILVSFQNISNLEGIQYFSSLKFLNCGGNTYTTLPTLPNSIQQLYCGSNSLLSLPNIPSSLILFNCISSVSLTNLPPFSSSIQTIICSNCALNSLPTLPNTLKTLDCSSNSLTALPVLPATLEYLYCSGNKLVNLPSLPNSLLILHCPSNSLTTLPTLPSPLNWLDVNNNSIKCFPTFPPNLYNVNLNNNPFNCLPNYILPAMNSYTNFPLCAAGNSNGCDVVGVEELDQTYHQLTIYPNPTSGQLTIDLNNSEEETVFIYDLNGKFLFSQELSGKTNINVSFLNEGIYNLTIKIGDNTLNKKLVIVK